MTFAINTDGKSWRSINAEADLMPGETLASTPPVATQSQTDLLQVATSMAKFRADRVLMLNTLTGMGMRAIAAGDTLLPPVLATFQQGLLDLPASPAIAAATTQAALGTAFKAYYGALVTAVPAALRTTVKGVLAS
jgi:hypothetical protein